MYVDFSEDCSSKLSLFCCKINSQCSVAPDLYFQGLNLVLTCSSFECLENVHWDQKGPILGTGYL